MLARGNSDHVRNVSKSGDEVLRRLCGHEREHPVDARVTRERQDGLADTALGSGHDRPDAGGVDRYGQPEKGAARLAERDRERGSPAARGTMDAGLIEGIPLGDHPLVALLAALHLGRFAERSSAPVVDEHVVGADVSQS